MDRSATDNLSRSPSTFEIAKIENDQYQSISKKRIVLSQKTVDETTSLLASHCENLASEVDLARIYDPPGITSLYVYFK